MSIFKRQGREKDDEIMLLKQSEEDDKRIVNEDNARIVGGLASTESALESTRQANIKFAKPDQYTGNRELIDSAAAKKNAKINAFEKGNVYDPYTGYKMVPTVKEAKQKYGKWWSRHLAETDHTMPLKDIYEENKKNSWLTNDDIRQTANSPQNIQVVSRKLNNAKRDHTNEEAMKVFEEKGIKIKDSNKFIDDGRKAEKFVSRDLGKATIKNVTKTGHAAGIRGAADGAEFAGTLSGINNIVAVIKGEKETDEAITDVIADTGRAAATGYVMSGGLTVISHTLSENSSKFVRALADSNVPGKVITAVSVVGNTLKRYAEGELSTQECLIELGSQTLNFATVSYSMTVGQSLIPIPVVGAVVGALAGSMLTGNYYENLVNRLKVKELEKRERQRIIEECNKAAVQIRIFREELEQYLKAYFKEYQDCFDEAFLIMDFACRIGDAEGIIAGANQVTRKLGGEVHYDTMAQFMDFIEDDSTDIL